MKTFGQIVRALGCCERRPRCRECPYTIKQCNDLRKNALALIKELTEEKETLEIIEKDLRLRNKELQKANEGLAKNCEELEDPLQSACQIKVSRKAKGEKQ